MGAVALIIVTTILIAVLLAMLMPGAGFIAAVLALLIGAGLVAWMLAAASSGEAPSDIVAETSEPEPELLGPGGPDDPRR
jgi:hypothetical protein